MTRATPLALALALAAAFPASAALSGPPSDKELKALSVELAAPAPPPAPSPALSESERAALEKALSSAAAEVRVGPGLSRAKAEGLKRFLAEVDVRTAPVKKIALAFNDCEAVDAHAAGDIPYFVKTFKAEVGYDGDWLYLPGTQGEADRTFKALRWLHGMSLKTFADGAKPRKKGRGSWEAEVVSLARMMPRMRIYDLYHFSAKKKGLVHDGLSTFLTGDPAPLVGGAEAEGEGGGIRRGRMLVAGLTAKGGPPAKRPPASEDPEDLCYADFDLESACLREDSDSGDDCLVELSDRINCLCHGACAESSARKARQ